MQEENRYMVVGRSKPSARFPNGHNLEISLADGGKIILASKYSDMGFEVPVPASLIMEAQCSAASIREAVGKIGNTIQAIMNTVELAVNAWLGDFEVELVYELFPGAGKREYFQSFVPEMPLTIVPSRLVDLPSALELMNKIHSHQDRRRLAQAIAQYHEALRHWQPGSELLCVEHIFMGIESIKKVALREHLRTTGKSAEQLGEEWEFRKDGSSKLVRFLEAEARARLIFMGDRECCQRTVDISDGFEHGYGDLAVLKKDAAQVILTSAKYLREAILRLSGMSKEKYDFLLSLQHPPRGPLRLVKYMWGHLDSDTEQLAAPGSTHPYCKWKSEIVRVYTDELRELISSHSETFTAVIGQGVTLTPGCTEAWDGSTIIKQPNPKLEPEN